MMLKQKEVTMKRFLILFFLLSAFFLFMLNCASNRTFGDTLQDADIKAMFENYEYVSNYNYFYTGYGNGPEAIVGIKKDYELVKVSGRINITNWQQFEPDSEKLNELVDAISESRYRRPPWGGIIYGPGRDQVSVLYVTGLPSTYKQSWFKEGNQIVVTPHQPYASPR
jgi:hypothetical protein